MLHDRPEEDGSADGTGDRSCDGESNGKGNGETDRKTDGETDRKTDGEAYGTTNRGAYEQPTEPEFGAGPLDPVKFEARKEEFINSLRGHGYNPPSIEDDLARAMEEYGLFNSTLYVADLDLSAFHYLTFSET